MDVEFYELAALLWFYDVANRQGYPLPEIPRKTLKNEFLDVQTQRNRLTPESYVNEWSSLAAIAQHYGIPTRMLDWSFDVNVALYFAVKDLPSVTSKKRHPKYVSLWILDKSKISTICDEIRFVMPRYSDNPNIGAQAGLFSVLTGDKPGALLELVVINAYGSASPEIRSLISKDGVPILTQLRIPYKEALKIKENFEGRGINFDSFFPGLTGVVRSMEIQSGIRKA